MADTTLSIRAAKKEDCQEIIRLIKELADYEKMPNGPKIDADILRRDGFDSPQPYFRCLVAENSDQPDKLVGYCLYFNVYSTWEGRSVYMEDLYVTPSMRGQGLGKRLWQELTRRALEEGCVRVNWACLDWNKPSIDFYIKQGARNLSAEEGWQDFRLDKAAMEAFVKSVKESDKIKVVA